MYIILSLLLLCFMFLVCLSYKFLFCLLLFTFHICNTRTKSNSTSPPCNNMSSIQSSYKCIIQVKEEIFSSFFNVFSDIHGFRVKSTGTLNTPSDKVYAKDLFIMMISEVLLNYGSWDEVWALSFLQCPGSLSLLVFYFIFFFFFIF